MKIGIVSWEPQFCYYRIGLSLRQYDEYNDRQIRHSLTEAAEYALEVGTILGAPEQAREEVEEAAERRDIGKFAVIRDGGEMLTDVPERIFLQIEDDGDLLKWFERSHCEDRVYSTDIEYIRADLVERARCECVNVEGAPGEIGNVN